MKRIACLGFLFPALITTMSATPAQAQATRTFVSAQSGSDSNPCSRSLPCRTFAFAITLTNAGGEINTLDPGGYGTVTITKSISIVSPLGEAGVLVPSGGTGITISAGANDTINLRGLIIEGGSLGAVGIKFNSGQALTIENSVVRNLTNDGIEFIPNVSTGSTASLAMSNTFVATNGGAGIVIQPSGPGTVVAVLNRVEAHNNATSGIVLNGSQSAAGLIIATATDSVVARNGIGFNAIGTQAKTRFLVIRSVVANNVTGLSADAVPSAMSISETAVSGNSSGFALTNGSTLNSYGDNVFTANGTNTGSLTPVTKQ